MIKLKYLLKENMIRTNGGKIGAVETMKDNPPFAVTDTYGNPVNEVEEQESPEENNIIDDLDLMLSKWEDTEHPYWQDVHTLLNKYTG
jgi:hypothetical protein